jgi:hypothetical protein
LIHLFTDSVCRFLGPVLLNIDRPRFLLLSLFHNAGDVEKRATGARVAGWAQWTEGARNWKTRSGVLEFKQGRVERAAGRAAIVRAEHADVAAGDGCAATAPRLTHMAQ